MILVCLNERRLHIARSITDLSHKISITGWSLHESPHRLRWPIACQFAYRRIPQELQYRCDFGGQVGRARRSRSLRIAKIMRFSFWLSAAYTTMAYRPIYHYWQFLHAHYLFPYFFAHRLCPLIACASRFFARHSSSHQSQTHVVENAPREGFERHHRRNKINHSQH